MKVHRLQWDLVHDFLRTLCGLTVDRLKNLTWEDKNVTCKKCLKKKTLLNGELR